MTATRLTFIATSHAIKEARPGQDESADFRLGAEAARRSIAEKLAVHFARSNPKFNRDTFMEKCGL